MEKNNVTSEELLDRILDITDGLYNEMSQYESEGVDNHIKIYGLLADLGRTIVGSDRASFWKWDKRTHELVTTAAVGADEIRIDEGTGLVGKALMERRAIVTNDPYNDPNFNSSVDKKTGYVTKSILVMPIVSCKGEYIGVYQAINKLSEDGFDLEADCKRLSLAAFICGLTLESDLFLDDSLHDKLTEIKNRMGFHSDYKSRYLPLLEDKESGSSVAMIMCDIDFFKKVNDTYGHNAGDAVLVHVAQILSSAIRGADGVYRWGGEEFIMIFPNTNMEEVATVAERIRSDVEASVCTFEGTDIKVTMSFGCGILTVDKSAEDNIKVADERLYMAKENGRNCVIWDKGVYSHGAPHVGSPR